MALLFLRFSALTRKNIELAPKSGYISALTHTKKIEFFVEFLGLDFFYSSE